MSNESGAHVISPFKSFVAGGIGGSCLIAVGHPFDTIKVRLQTMPHVGPGGIPLYRGMLDCAKKTMVNEGILGFYKGMSAPIIGVTPIFAACFLGYNLGKKIFAKDPHNLRRHEVLLAGMFSGVFTTVIMAPGERIKCLLQVQTHGDIASKYKGPLDVVRQLYLEGGVRSLFRGTSATFLRDVPASGAWFLSYEWIKDLLRRRDQRSVFEAPFDNVHQINVGQTLLAGGLAGVCNWLVAIAPDVLKSRLQSAPEGRYPNGIRSVFSELIAKEGFLALYTGLVPVILRAFPANAACFLGFELTVKFLDFLVPHW